MPKPRNDLSADYVRSILDYEPETGIFRWRVRVDVPTEWNTRRAGKPAGGMMTTGYRYIAINNAHYLAHRIAWLHYHGEWPTDQLDHADMNRSNNRIANLREADNSENNSNRPKERGNQSGYKGVKLHKKSGLYHARITHHGKEHSLGYYKDPKDAHKAYCDACTRLHGRFARF